MKLELPKINIKALEKIISRSSIYKERAIDLEKKIIFFEQESKISKESLEKREKEYKDKLNLTKDKYIEERDTLLSEKDKKYNKELLSLKEKNSELKKQIKILTQENEVMFNRIKGID